jgi:hypothetical protein
MVGSFLWVAWFGLGVATHQGLSLVRATGVASKRSAISQTKKIEQIAGAVVSRVG